MSRNAEIHNHFEAALERALSTRDSDEVRLGAELKFPLVTHDGAAAGRDVVDRLWRFLEANGWGLELDPGHGRPVGARNPGPRNDTVASCETGYCKPEFSLAHVADLHQLKHAVKELHRQLRPFADEHNVHFLGYGIQPVTPPTKHLMMKQTRTSVWDKVFGSNRVLAPEDGDDVCLFTVNAATHVHVSLPKRDMIPAVNVLNGFSGAQIALTADSSVWRGRVDRDLKCVAETFWDWWIPEPGRVGVPDHAFADLGDYSRTVSAFRPVYVKRNGIPYVLTDYPSFADYYTSDGARGYAPDGTAVELTPDPADLDLHNTCYWFNARISGYFTVENRTNDQQPPRDILTVAALTLGLAQAREEASEEVSTHPWSALQRLRTVACHEALGSRDHPSPCFDVSKRMLDIAELGLQRRDRGEEVYLAPLRERLTACLCPADEAASVFRIQDIAGLIETRSFTASQLDFPEP